MRTRFNVTLIALVVVVILGRMSLFTVDQRDYALKFRFGQIVKSDYKPGLHFKIPFVNRVVKYSNLIRNYDDAEEKFLTGGKRNLIVDYFVTWRVVNPAQYYRSVEGNEQRAINRLSAIVKEGMKAAISRRTVQQVVSAERTDLMKQTLAEARKRSPQLGVQVVDVRVKRIDLSDEVSDSVYSRMRKERERTATQLRAEGEEEYERIQADANRQKTVILANAYRDAQRIRGQGDAKAAEIYAKAYKQDPGFYAFYRSMQAYKQSIGGNKDVLVLKPDGDFFRFLQRQFGAQTASK